MAGLVFGTPGGVTLICMWSGGTYGLWCISVAGATSKPINEKSDPEVAFF